MKKLLTMTLLLALTASWTVQAAEGKDAAKRERAMQRRMQQISAEKEALAQENAALKAKVAELEEAAAAAERKAGRLGKDMKVLENAMEAGKTEHDSALLACRQETQSALQNGEALQAKLAQTEQQLGETKASLAQTQAEKKGLQGEKLSLEKNLEQHSKQIAGCQEKNRKLYGVTREVIDRQRNDALFTKEPLFGLGKVEVENLFQEYEDRAYAEKIPAKQ